MCVSGHDQSPTAVRYWCSFLVLTIAFLSCSSGDAAAQSQTVFCESLGIEVRLNPTQEPECLRG